MENSCDSYNKLTALLHLPSEAKTYKLSCTAAQEHSQGENQQMIIAPFDREPLIYNIDSHEVFPLTPCNCGITEVHDNLDGKYNYCVKISSLLSRLNERQGKTVISRPVRIHTTLSAEQIFSNLCIAYPDSTTYAWNNGNDWWIGATPEVLLDVDSSRIRSMSLAGTRAVSNDDEPWDTKNIREQEIVTRYICNVFEGFKLVPIVGERKTLKAGPVEHICNEITADYNPGNRLDTLSLAQALSPTPAVCGYPKKDALRNIAEYETHDRGFYAGFFGIRSGNNLKLYVTLRCIKLASDGIGQIYVGGGITPLSDPYAEWQETCYKAATILKVL